MPSGEDITYGLVTDDTATNMFPQPATESQDPLTAVREVHEIPSVEVMTAFVPTATNNPFPYVTACQLESDADAREVHVTPSVDVITLLPEPVDDTATNVPFPYATLSQSLSTGYPAADTDADRATNTATDAITSTAVINERTRDGPETECGKTMTVDASMANRTDRTLQGNTV